MTSRLSQQGMDFTWNRLDQSQSLRYSPDQGVGGSCSGYNWLVHNCRGNGLFTCDTIDYTTKKCIEYIEMFCTVNIDLWFVNIWHSFGFFFWETLIKLPHMTVNNTIFFSSALFNNIIFHYAHQKSKSQFTRTVNWSIMNLLFIWVPLFWKYKYRK